MLDSLHLHPALVHFPVAAIFIGFVFETISFFWKKDFLQKPGFYLLAVGAVGSIVAWRTGDADAEAYKTIAAFTAAIDSHEMWGQISMYLSISATFFSALFIYAKKSSIYLRWISFVLLFLCVLSMFRTGFTGGELVYSHGIGVAPARTTVQMK